MIKSKIDSYLSLLESHKYSDRRALSKLRSTMTISGDDRVSISIYKNLIVITIGKEWLHIYKDNDVRASTMNTFSRTMHFKVDIFNRAMEI